MKVLFVGNDQSIVTGENADAGERMRLYARHFDQLAIIIFSLKKYNLKTIVENNLAIYPTNSNNRRNFVLDSLKIISDHNDFDLVSAQDPFIAGLVGVLTKLFWKKKLNIQLHNDFFDNPYFRSENPQNLLFFCLGKFNLLFADSIRAVSKRLVKDSRYFVAPVATDLGFFWSPPHTKKYRQIVTVARLSKQKNLPLLFSVAETFPDLKFVVVGEGEKRKSLESVKPSNVLLVGQKSRSVVKEILAKSDIFVLTSNYEGWGISVLEAIAAGLPVIMTNTGCAGEVVVDGKIGGFVVESGDRLELIDSINKLSRDINLRKRLVVACQKNIFQKYSQELLVNQFMVGLNRTK